jgi:hypothetical protein
MTLRLNGSTSGYTEIDAPAAAGNNTLKLPSGNGSDGQILGTDGAGNLSWVGGRMVLETAKASTSGTSVDFTGIPSWVKKITVMFQGVSTNGTSDFLIQLGDSGGIETTGYLGASSAIGATVASTNYTAGFGSAQNNAANLTHGSFVITLFESNTWTIAGLVARSNFAGTITTAGSKTLSDTLDRIRITTSNGTDTFDAGSVNLLLEG